MRVGATTTNLDSDAKRQVAWGLGWWLALHCVHKHVQVQLDALLLLPQGLPLQLEGVAAVHVRVVVLRRPNHLHSGVNTTPH